MKKVLKVSVAGFVYDYFEQQSKLSNIKKSDLVNDVLEHYVMGKPMSDTMDRLLKDILK